ncbi:MAG: hypothetical protein QM723_08400 [Myxococcaceae bacterium]
MRFASVLLSLCATVAFAAPVQLPYQGRLDKAGKPLSGSYDLQFTLFDTPSGGNQLWTDTFTAVPVVAGAFSVKLGGGAALDSALLKSTRFVSISVKGPGETSFTPLAGRQELLSTPRAVYALGSEQDFGVGGNLTVGADAGVTVNSPAGVPTVTLSQPGSSLSITPGAVNQSGTLNLQQGGGGSHFGGDVSVNGNLTANNIGLKIVDTNSALGTISVPINLSAAKTYRIFIDGRIYATTTNVSLYLKAVGVGGYRSQIYSLGDWNGYLNDTAGFILGWNPDNTDDIYNTALTVTFNNVNGCIAMAVSGNWDIVNVPQGRYFFGVNGGAASCVPSNLSSLSITTNATNIFTAHVVAYQLPN